MKSDLVFQYALTKVRWIENLALASSCTTSTTTNEPTMLRIKYSQFRIEISSASQPDLEKVKAGKLSLQAMCVACDAPGTNAQHL